MSTSTSVGHVFFILVVSCLVPSHASGRILPAWPYEKLFKSSDLVVIASLISSEEVADHFTDERWPLKFVGVNSRFRVSQVVKGKRDKQTLTLLHFRFEGPKKREGAQRRGNVQGALDRSLGQTIATAQVQIIDGPLFVRFQTKDAFVLNIRGGKVTIPRRDFLLFLKARDDGRFELVSGRIDPALAVREIFEPLPKSLGGSADGEN